MSACRRIQIDAYLSPYTKIKSKWIKDFNKKKKTDTLKQTEEDLGNSLECFG